MSCNRPSASGTGRRRSLWWSNSASRNSAHGRAGIVWRGDARVGVKFVAKRRLFEQGMARPASRNVSRAPSPWPRAIPALVDPDANRPHRAAVAQALEHAIATVAQGADQAKMGHTPRPSQFGPRKDPAIIVSGRSTSLTGIGEHRNKAGSTDRMSFGLEFPTRRFEGEGRPRPKPQSAGRSQACGGGRRSRCRSMNAPASALSIVLTRAA